MIKDKLISNWENLKPLAQTQNIAISSRSMEERWKTIFDIHACAPSTIERHPLDEEISQAPLNTRMSIAYRFE